MCTASFDPPKHKSTITSVTNCFLCVLYSDVSIGFDPTEYNVTEGNSTNLVIRRTGNAELPVVARVISSDITTTGKLIQCHKHLKYCAMHFI